MTARPSVFDLALIALVVAVSLFAACWVAGFDGFTGWVLGVVNVSIAHWTWTSLRREGAS